MTIDDRLAVLVIDNGVPVTHAATVVHRDQYVMHISTDVPLTLALGSVVALLAPGGGAVAPDGSATSLALVSERFGSSVTALRLLERRNRPRPGTDLDPELTSTRN
jgi:hypothetical protein